MTNIDQFESVFKSADKTPFARLPIRAAAVLVVSGLDPAHRQPLDEAARSFLGSLETVVSWQSLTGDQFDQVEPFLELVRQAAPDVICTYRNLRTPARDYAYSLGVFVEVLTQATETPVLLLPTPRAGRPTTPSTRRAVMAITDHLTGQDQLVSYAAHFTEPGGTLYLTHVEDQATFDRYMQTISKIPEIDTETARETILEQLLKEPRDYIHSCREVLGQQAQQLRVEEIITMGHHLTDYQRLVNLHEIDLLVMNTKDEDQTAMHGLAYPLAVELRETPLLLL